MTSLLRPTMRNLPAYNAGVRYDIAAQQAGGRPFAKLDSNESPLPPSPQIIAAIAAAGSSSNRYPDRSATALAADISARTGHPADLIFFGDGSEDIISVLYRTVLAPGERVVTLTPGFGLFEFWAGAAEAAVTKLAFSPDWSWPVDALIAEAAKQPRIMILSSPCNPTGTALTEAELARLVAAIPPETIFVLDEAYVEFVSPERRVDALSLLRAARCPWLVLRTFSKAYGLAGLRIGYAFLDRPDLFEPMLKMRCPFGVNHVAQAAALAALRDDRHLASVVELIWRERPKIEQALISLGRRAVRSDANFVFVDCGCEGTELSESLRRRNIYIKPWLEPPFTRFARIGVGLPAENQLLIAGLTAFFASPPLAEPAAALGSA